MSRGVLTPLPDEPGCSVDEHGHLYVDDDTWAAWQRRREAQNRAYDAWCRRERAKPVRPSYDDLVLQLHALRWANEQLAHDLRTALEMLWPGGGDGVLRELIGQTCALPPGEQ